MLKVILNYVVGRKSAVLLIGGTVYINGHTAAFGANEAESGGMQNARLVAGESWCELSGVGNCAVEQRLSHKIYRDLLNCRVQPCGEVMLWTVDGYRKFAD